MQGVAHEITPAGQTSTTAARLDESNSNGQRDEMNMASRAEHASRRPAFVCMPVDDRRRCARPVRRTMVVSR